MARRNERPIEYLPIQDHGLIGDGSTAALVGTDGSISWLCVPRFDSPPLFGAILDSRQGGSFSLSLTDGTHESQQYYLDDTAVLVTELRSESGVVRLTDALALRDGFDPRSTFSRQEKTPP